MVSKSLDEGSTSLDEGSTSLDEVNIDYIKKCSNKKSELMCRLVNMYTDNVKELNIADFGAGFGGTSRYIKKSLSKTINIDCYDLSKENCVINTNKNIRPSYLCRGNLSGVLDDTSKSKFTRSEMGKPC